MLYCLHVLKLCVSGRLICVPVTAQRGCFNTIEKSLKFKRVRLIFISSNSIIFHKLKIIYFYEVLSVSILEVCILVNFLL